MFDCLNKSNILHSWTTVAGYPAIVIGMDTGYRCGYIQLPDSHPCAGQDYSELDISVHGGLTYGNGAVFGFDCAHYGDAADVSIMSDAHRELSAWWGIISTYDTIRTTEFCIAECESMAEQFKKLES